MGADVRKKTPAGIYFVMKQGGLAFVPCMREEMGHNGFDGLCRRANFMDSCRDDGKAASVREMCPGTDIIEF